MAQAVLGIDVSKDTLDVALLVADRPLHKHFENSPLGHQQIVQWLRKQHTDEVHVCLEATGQYGEGVAEYLYLQSCAVSVVNPARIKHYGNSKLRRNKTDKADAQLIAEYCLREKPALWSPPPAAFKDLQVMIRHLEDMQVAQQQQKNRLMSGVHNPFVVGQLQNLVAVLEAQIQQTKQAIQEHINAYPALKQDQDLLVSIPGIGHLTAAKLLGEIRNIRDFTSARQLAAYAGVTPKQFISGSSVHKKSHLSKTGNRNLRKMLYLPAISAKHWNPIVHTFCERLLQSGLKPMEVIGAAMRKLLHLVFGILKTGRPFDPNYLADMQVLS